MIFGNLFQRNKTNQSKVKSSLSQTNKVALSRLRLVKSKERLQDTIKQEKTNMVL